MELYMRIKKVALEVSGSVAKMATQINVPQTTFNGYLNARREHKLWPLLPRVLTSYPQLSREWLYFDEGEMLRSSEISPLEQEVINLRSEIIDVYREYRKLRQQLDGQALPDSTAEVHVIPARDRRRQKSKK